MLCVGIKCQNEYSQRHGIDAMVMINGKGMKGRSRGFFLKSMGTQTAVCINRILLVRDPTDERTMLKKIFERVLYTAIQKFWGKKIVIVAEDSPSSTRKALEKLGIHPSTIPIHLGGEWNWDECVNQWVNQQLQMEDAAATSSDEIMTHKVSEKRKRKDDQGDDSFASDKPSEEKRRKFREKSAYHSRNCYKKKKEELKELTEESDRLQVNNELLRAEGKRLESLIERARAIVNVFADPLENVSDITVPLPYG